MTTVHQPKTAFLIHSHADRKPVHRLYLRLAHDGVNVWMDVERLQPGQDWQREIHKAILACDVVLVCLSGNFNERQGYRHKELSLALDKARFMPVDEVSIIPVRLEACDLPESLSHLQRVDLFQPGGYRQLIRVLKRQSE